MKWQPKTTDGADVLYVTDTLVHDHAAGETFEALTGLVRLSGRVFQAWWDHAGRNLNHGPCNLVGVIDGQ